MRAGLTRFENTAWGRYVAIISSSQNNYGAVILRIDVIIDFPNTMLYTLRLRNADHNRTVIKTIIGYTAEHA